MILLLKQRYNHSHIDTPLKEIYWYSRFLDDPDERIFNNKLDDGDKDKLSLLSLDLEDILKNSDKWIIKRGDGSVDKVKTRKLAANLLEQEMESVVNYVKFLTEKLDKSKLTKVLRAILDKSKDISFNEHIYKAFLKKKVEDYQKLVNDKKGVVKLKGSEGEKLLKEMEKVDNDFSQVKSLVESAAKASVDQIKREKPYLDSSKSDIIKNYLSDPHLTNQISEDIRNFLFIGGNFNVDGSGYHYDYSFSDGGIKFWEVTDTTISNSVEFFPGVGYGEWQRSFYNGFVDLYNKNR